MDNSLVSYFKRKRKNAFDGRQALDHSGEPFCRRGVHGVFAFCGLGDGLGHCDENLPRPFSDHLRFFSLTNSFAIRSVELEHELFDAKLGANLSPSLLSRDLPLFWVCTPARREAQRIMWSPPT